MKYYWYIDSGNLKFVDEHGNDSSLSPVTVKYRKRLYNEIPEKSSEVTATLTISHDTCDVTVMAGSANVSEIFVYFVDPLLGRNGVVSNLEDKYYVADNKLYLNDDELDIADYVERNYSVVILEDLWEEQDDGLDTDLQIAALYLALSKAADMVGGDREVSKYFFDKYNYEVKDLRRKYNSSKYKNIVIRPYDF